MLPNNSENTCFNNIEGVRGEVINDFPQKQNFYLESSDWWVKKLTRMYIFFSTE